MVDIDGEGRRGLVPCELLRRHLLGCLAIAFCGCAAPPADAQSAPAVSPAAIIEISLERDCFGCASGSLLVLRRDGSARLDITGHARHGTASASASAVLPRADFDAVARAVVDQDFFALADRYEDAQTRDGAWSSIRVVRDGKGKTVLSRGEGAPASLRALQAAIESLQARLRFVPMSR